MKKYTQEEAILLTDNAIKQINIDFDRLKNLNRVESSYDA